MRSAEATTAGGVSILVPDRVFALRLFLLGAVTMACGGVTAQSTYKYRGENGEWIYSDRPPADGRDSEVRFAGPTDEGNGLFVRHSLTDDSIEFTATNNFYAPMEVELIFENIVGVAEPDRDEYRRRVVPPRSNATLLDLPALGNAAATVTYRYEVLPGDPAAQPAAGITYRVPYTSGTSHAVTQAYPDTVTHLTRDSLYAVDFSMPIGTRVVAARDGVVFDVSTSNFSGGADRSRYADLANLVRILHDDGTFAVYAHLNWNSIRVSLGDQVMTGQHIADSGNSGFSSGPHLHFAVQRNLGMRVESLPVAFRGPDGAPVSASRGDRMTAYP
jgi:murein DD-endopeptidase MepM/ murein hydrolase activator NlpD